MSINVWLSYSTSEHVVVSYSTSEHLILSYSTSEYVVVSHSTWWFDLSKTWVKVTLSNSLLKLKGLLIINIYEVTTSSVWALISWTVWVCKQRNQLLLSRLCRLFSIVLSLVRQICFQMEVSVTQRTSRLTLNPPKHSESHQLALTNCSLAN